MVWKTVNNTDPGDATHFGGDDRDKISNLFNGLLNVDSVDINSLWKFRDQKLEISNPANTFGYFIRSAALVADRDISLPLLTGNDTFVFESHAATLLNKIIDAANNTITNIGASEVELGIITGQTLKATPVGADEILISDSAAAGALKRAAISTLPGGGGGDMILAAAQTVSGAKTFLDTTMLLRNVANTFNGSFVNTNTADRIYTLPDAAGTISLTGLAETLLNKTLTTPTIADLTNMTHSHLNAAGGGQITEAAISDLQAYLLNITGEPIGDLSDVTITAVAGNEVLVRNAGNTAWINDLLVNANIDAAAAIATSKLADAANFVLTDQTNTYGDGLKQIFNPNATNAGLNVGTHTAEPSVPVVGDIIYDSTAGQFKGYDGAWINLGAGAGGGEANLLASLGGGTALTAAVPKSGVTLQTVSIATTAPITHSVTTDLLTIDINDLTNADLATGVFGSITGIGTLTQDLDLAANEINVTAGALGDLLKHTATGFARFARGTPLQVLRVNAGGTDLEYATLAAGGDVVGPASSTDTGVARYDDATGKLIKDSARVLIDDANQYLNLTHTSIRELALGRPETLVDDTEIGHVNFNAFDGAAALDTYAQIRGVMAADAVGVEDGDLFLSVMHNGALADLVKIGDNSGFTSVVNDVDFFIMRSLTLDVDVAISRQQVLADQTAIGTQSWQALNSLGNAVRVYADIQGVMEDDTDTTEDGSFRIEVMEAGTPQTLYMSFNDAIDGAIAIYKTLNANGQSIVNGLFFESAAANVPAAGVARYGNAEEIRWRNNGNTDDLRLTASITDEFAFVINGVSELSIGTNLLNLRDADLTNFNTMVSNALDVAQAGSLRFGNAETVRWRNGADTNDHYIGYNGADQFEIRFNVVGEYSFSATQLDMFDNNLDMGNGIITFVDANTTIQSAAQRLQIDYGATFGIDFRSNNTTIASVDDLGINLLANALRFVTDGHDITPSATALTFDLGVATDDYIFQTGGVTRLTISDAIINAAAAVTFQENGTDISPIGTHDQYLGAGNFDEITAGAVAVRIVDGGVDRKALRYMPFTTGVVEFATAMFQLPRNYDGGTITAIVHWTTEVEGAGTVEWDISAFALSDGDDYSNTIFPAAVTVTDTQSTINFEQLSPRSAAITIGGTPAAQDMIVLKIARDGVNDTFTSFAQLLGVSIEISIDAATAT